MIAGSPLSKASATWALESAELVSLWYCQVRVCVSPAVTGIGLAAELGDERVPEAQRIEAERGLLLGRVAHGRAQSGRQEPLAVGVEQPVVVVGDHLVAAEDDHSAPLLEVILERRDLGLG